MTAVCGDASAVRFVWLADPAGFSGSLSAPIRSFTLRMPQILWLICVLLFIAVWKRISGAKNRIKSAFVVGRYKYHLWVLITVLVLLIPLSIVSASGSAVNVISWIERVVVSCCLPPWRCDLEAGLLS
jgi:hypothetical protein